MSKSESSVRYKGYASPTLHLVLLSFISGTALLVTGYIPATVWETGVLGAMTAYILATGMSKAAEAYMVDKGPQQIASQQAPIQAEMGTHGS